MKNNCLLCNKIKDKKNIIYSGDIRKSGINSGYFKSSIYSCNICNLVQLYKPSYNISNYEKNKYNKEFNVESDKEYFKRFDKEQNERISRIGIQNLRNMKVLDIGPAYGIFLDVVKNIAKSTFAVEPSSNMRKHLESNGHSAFKSLSDLSTFKSYFNVITCFDVIEHVKDPLNLLNQSYNFLNKGGKMFLSMPNHDDLLLDVIGNQFKKFFYQKSHLSYFDYKSTKYLIKKSKFKNYQLGYLHKYDIQNLFSWMNKKIDYKYNLFDKTFDTFYKNNLESKGLTSHLFITLIK